jgi:hypothetical protein
MSAGKNLDPHLIYADTDQKKADVVDKYLRRKDLELKFMGWVDIDDDRIFEGIGVYNTRGHTVARIVKTEGRDPSVKYKQGLETDGSILTYIIEPLKYLVERAYEEPVEPAESNGRGDDEPSPVFRLLKSKVLSRFFEDEYPLEEESEHDENIEQVLKSLHEPLSEEEDEHDHRVEEHGEM